MLGTRRRPTIKTKNNKTELLNPEEGEDNMGDAVGKKKTEGRRRLRIERFYQTAALLFVKFEDICCKKHQTIKPFGNVKLEFANKKRKLLQLKAHL